MLTYILAFVGGSVAEALVTYAIHHFHGHRRPQRVIIVEREDA